MSDDDGTLTQRVRETVADVRASVVHIASGPGWTTAAGDDDDDDDDEDEDDDDRDQDEDTDRDQDDDDDDDDDDDGDEDEDEHEDRDEDDEDRDGDDDRLLADGGWNGVDSPTSRTLHGVIHAADGSYACGEGGILLSRDGGEWRTLLERGPGVANNTLRSIDATDDGCRIWFAGDSGALGVYDVADGRLSDYSAPMEKTSTWEAIAVSGRTGEEHLRVANGSGEVLDIVCEDGCPVWGDVVEPGGGSTIPGLTSGPDGFYAIDTSGGVYVEPDANDDTESTSESGDEGEDEDGGESESESGTQTEGDTESQSTSGAWEKIGIRNAEVDFHDIWAGENTVYVAGSDGIAYRYDPKCENWTPLHVGDGALQAIRAVGTDATAAATGGRIYERTDSLRWDRLETSTEQSLFDLVRARSREDVEDGLATVSVDVAVGAGGTILERSRDP